MTTESPIVYRFKIFPFLNEKIVPTYKDFLKTQGNGIITFSDEETEMMKKYEKLFDYQMKITNTVDVKIFHPFFEIMEKHMKFLHSSFNRVNLTSSEKLEILNHFEEDNRPLVMYLISDFF